MSEQRQVLPGLYYHLPPTQGKRDPFAVTEDELASLLSAQTAPKRLDGWLLETLGGFSPLVCRELAFRLCGETDAPLSALRDPDAAGSLLAGFFAEPFSPTLLLEDGTVDLGELHLHARHAVR